MHCFRKITSDLYWVGGSDRRLELFENIFPLSKGVSYNSYLLTDEKTVLFDTADHAIGHQFLENIKAVLNGRALDYLVVNHMEPDHCAMIEELILRYPNMQIIGNAKTFPLISQFFDFDLDGKAITVKEGDTFSSGAHTLHFIMAPMIHWPETMMTYDETDKVLFSADAFGTFGALNGNIFNDEVDFDREWLDETRRYYTNIVGKYGIQVQNVLKKTAELDIRVICPLHGPIWRTNLDYIIEKYDTWSRYEPEEAGVMIAYASMYGNTEAAAQALAGKLDQINATHLDTRISVTGQQKELKTLEEAINAMLDRLGANEQLIFTTHNTDMLDLNLPKHSYVFLRKQLEDGIYKVSAVSASDILKRNTDSVRNAVENDVFSSLPQDSLLDELEIGWANEQ